MLSNSQYAQYSDRISCTVLRLTKELVEMDGWTFRRQLVGFSVSYNPNSRQVRPAGVPVTIPDQIGCPAFAGRCDARGVSFPAIHADGTVILVREDDPRGIHDNPPEEWKGRVPLRRVYASDMWYLDPLWLLDHDEPWVAYEAQVFVIPVQGWFLSRKRADFFRRIDSAGKNQVQELSHGLQEADHLDYLDAKLERAWLRF